MALRQLPVMVFCLFFLLFILFLCFLYVKKKNNNRYLKNTLNTSDDEKVKEVIHAFLNGDLGDVLLGDGSQWGMKFEYKIQL